MEKQERWKKIKKIRVYREPLNGLDQNTKEWVTLHVAFPYKRFVVFRSNAGVTYTYSYWDLEDLERKGELKIIK